MPRRRAQKTNKNISRTGNTKALIYCRVSSDKQKYEGNGLESQEHRCKEYARQKGYEVAEVFKDTFTGGGDYGLRPALSLLLHYIDENPAQSFVVIFDDLSRFARDVQAHFQLRQALHERGVATECPNFKFEETPEGELIETMMAAQHAYHRKNNKRQVIQKQKARMESGFWPHRAMKGYVMVKDPMHGKVLVADEEFAPMIKYALEGFANGIFPRVIDCCRYLCEQGYWGKQSPEKYIDKFKTDILMNSVYAGFVEHEGWGVTRRKGFHKGIISEEIFYKNQKRLESESLGKRVRVDVSDDFPLRGLVLCEHCEKPMTAANSRGRSSTYPYYFCQNKVCAKHRKNIRAEKLHDDFISLLKKQKLKDDIDVVINEVFEVVWKEEVSEVVKENKQTSVRLSEVREKMGKYNELCFSDEVDDAAKEFYRDEFARLTEEYSDLKKQTHNLTDTDVPYRTALDKSTKLLKSPYDIWVSLDVRDQQEMFFFVFDKKLPYNKETGYRTGEILCATRLFEEFVTTNSHDVEMGRIELPSEFGHIYDSTMRSSILSLNMVIVDQAKAHHIEFEQSRGPNRTI